MDKSVESIATKTRASRNYGKWALFALGKILAAILLYVMHAMAPIVLDVAIRVFYYNPKYLAIGFPLFINYSIPFVICLVPSYLLLLAGLPKKAKMAASVLFMILVCLIFFNADLVLRESKKKHEAMSETIKELKQAPTDHLEREAKRVASFFSVPRMNLDERSYAINLLSTINARGVPNRDDIFFHVYQHTVESDSPYSSSMAVKMHALSLLSDERKWLLLKDLIDSSLSAPMRRSAVRLMSDSFKGKAIPVILQQLSRETDLEVVNEILYRLRITRKTELLVQKWSG